MQIEVLADGTIGRLIILPTNNSVSNSSQGSCSYALTGMQLITTDSVRMLACRFVSDVSELASTATCSPF